MSIRTEPFGEKAHLYTLENTSGTRLVLTDVGAAAVSLVFRGTDILLGWDDPARYFDGDGCEGATVGRVANRTAGARFTINGKEYRLAKNDGENNLHSGPNGWHRRLWRTTGTDGEQVTFFLDSPDGDQGFPGHVQVSVSYTLTEDDEVRLDCTAETDADTPINLTNHAYFNLNGHGSGDVLGHRLRIFADCFTPLTAALIPTGEICSVEGTPFDFREERGVGERIGDADPRLVSAGGYDLSYPVRGEGLRPAAELTGERSGLRLTVLTDEPAVQLYTGNFLSGERGKGGAVYGRRGGLCLETQDFPNAVNEPRFPTVILSPGRVWRRRTVWRLSQTR